MLVIKAHPVRLAGAKWAPSRVVRLRGAEEDAQQLEQSVDGIASYLLDLSERLQDDLVLALDPLRFEELPLVATPGMLTQNEVIGAVDKAAEGLAEQILAVLQPPLGPYVTPASAEVLASANSRVAMVRETVVTALEFSPPGDLLLHPLILQDYADAFLEPAAELIQLAEQSVVRLESGNIPVYEEDEKGFGLWKVIAVAGIVVGLIALGTYSAGGK